MRKIDEAIDALKSKSIAEPRVGPPPTEEQLSVAQEQLGCKFPPSFLRFLAVGGAYQLSFWETYWVGPSERNDIVEMNRQEREEAEPALPPFLITFFNNGMGDQLCFDTRSPDSNDEYPIVFWDHEVSQEENLSELEKVAGTFADWLMQEVEEAS